MTRHSMIRNVIRKLFSPRAPSTIRKAPIRQRPYLERLEERLAPTVDPQLLAGGILDIGFNAANDQATVSVIDSNIDVYGTNASGGMTHTDFAASAVDSINAHGNNAANQSVALNSTVTLGGNLGVFGLTHTTLNGTYSVNFASMADSGTIDITNGANLTAGGGIELTTRDTETGLTATSSAQVTISGATLQAGGDIILSATSTLTPTATGSVSAAINAQSNALVSIDGSSQITALGDVTIAASSTVNSSAVAQALSVDNTNLPVDADVATSTLVSSSIADVSGATTVSAGGAFSLSATNNSTATTTANGAAGGSSAGGASVANVGISDTTKAFLDGSATIAKAASVNVSATETDTDTTTATSTAKGAAQNSSSTLQILAANAAKTSEGKIGLAAAVAVTNLTRDTQAYIASTGSVASSGSLGVTSSSSSNDTTDADGSDTINATEGGVGVAVAINRATQADNTAYIGGSGSVSAKGVAVQALMPTPSTFGAKATSGAGALSVGVAGAFALNDVPSHTSSAVIQSGANVNAGGGNVTISAANNTTNSAAATSEGKGTATLGVGASVALNLAKQNTADAEVQDNAGLTNVGALKIAATSTQTETADVDAGADGGIALMPAVAVIVSADATTARLGIGATSLMTGGAVSITATHTGSAASTAKGEAGGDKAAVGAAVAVNQVSDNTTAAVARALTSGGAVTVAAQSSQGAEADATASAHAPKPNITTANGMADSLLAAAGSTLTVPIFKANGDTVGVAAALGLNLASSSAQATISGASLTATGLLTVGASDSATFTASGDGSAVRPDVGVDPSKAGVGVGVAVNMGSASGQAAIDAGVVVQSLGLSLTADNGPSGGNTFTATATSGGGGSSVGVAGSFAFNDIANNTSSALIDGGASVDAGGGDVDISAANTSTSTATAVPASDDPAKGETLGVGPSVAVNVLSANTADAEAQDTAGLADAGNVNVTATGIHTVTTQADNGAAGGKLGVAAGIAVALVTNDTTAKLGSAPQISFPLPTLSATGAVTVSAVHRSSTTTTTDGETRGDKVGIGASVGVAVVNDNATAAIDRSISTPGAVSVTTTTTTANNLDPTGSANGAPENPLAGSNADDQASGAADDASSSAGQPPPALTSALTTLVNIADQIQTDGAPGIGTLGVAGAVGVNDSTTDSSASLGVGANVTAGGAVNVISTDQSGTQVLATGTSLINKNAIGAAVGVNAATVDNEATISPTDKVFGSSITVQAALPTAVDYDFQTRALGAGGGEDVGAAGSVGINVLNITSQASVGAGSVLGAGTGGIAVTTRNDTQLQNVAGGASLGKDAGIGAAVAVNVITNTTKAFIDDNTTANSSGAITVEADASFAPLVTGDLPTDPLSVAAGGALSTKVSVAGSVTVNVISDTTLAYIGAGANINAAVHAVGQTVTVSATDDTTIRDEAGGFAVGSNLAVGMGLDVNIFNQKDTEAYIASSASDRSNVQAGGNVSVRATTEEDLTSLAAEAGAAAKFGLAGAVVINILGANSSHALDTLAHIGDDAAVLADGNLTLAAADTMPRTQLGNTAVPNLGAGSLAIGAGTGGVGASNTTLVRTEIVKASIGQDDDLTALGASGLSVTATSTEDLFDLPVGGTAGGKLGISGSVAVNTINDTTLAYIDQGTNIGQGTTIGASNVAVHAADNTTLLSTPGSLAVSGTVGLGAGVDVGTLNKNTQAYISTDNVVSSGDVSVTANSGENLTSISASAVGGGTAGFAGTAGVQVMNVTTRAFIGADPTANPAQTGAANVSAGGNVQVAATEGTTLLMVSGNIGVGGEAAIGVAAGVPIVTKTTEAFIGQGSEVNAHALGDTMQVDTGKFTVGYVPYNTNQQGVVSPEQNGRQINTDPEGNGSDPGSNPGLSMQRTTSANTETMQGVAVTAINTDDIQDAAASAGASTSVAVNVYGAATVLQAKTNAYIGSGAKVNANNTGDGADQSVVVAAGDDFSYLGIVPGGAVSGDVAGALGTSVLVAKNSTTAHIDDGAAVSARGDIAVAAQASENILTIAAGISAAVTGVGVGGSAAVISMDNTTLAYIGQSAGDLAQGAKVTAGGNVLVAASDDTSSFQFGGNVAIGLFGGLGASASVTVLDKDTEAFVGKFATVDALGNSPSVLTGIYDGNITSGSFETGPNMHGLAVQASSSEHVFNIGVSGDGGLIAGIGGGVSVEIVNSTTKAYLDNGAMVNTDRTDANADQAVNVSAVNSATVFGFAGALGIGAVGLAGGVDVGVLRNNTSAYIANGAEAHASQGVDVNALALKNVTSYGVSGAGGLGALAGSVSVWTIGTDYDPNYSTNGQSASAINSTGLSNSVSSNNSSNGKGTGVDNQVGNFAGILNSYSGAGSDQTQNARTQLTNDVPTGQVNDALNATNIPVGTVAFIGSGANVTAGGEVGVRAKDNLTFNDTVGSGAIGFVGLSGSVAVVNIKVNPQAYIDSNSVVSAGGNVVVDSELVDNPTGHAYVGLGGIVALGAQVVDIQDSSTATAWLNANVSIPQAQQVQVTATSNRSLDAEAMGVTAGVVALGAAVAIADATGGTFANIGSHDQIGQSQSGTVGSLDVAATSTDSATANATAVTAGIVAGGANVAQAEITPENEIQASIGFASRVTTSNDITVDAASHGEAEAHVFGVQVGLGTVGVNISDATLAPTVLAFIDSSSQVTSSNGNISVLATHDTAGGAQSSGNTSAGSAVNGLGAKITATGEAQVFSFIGESDIVSAGKTVTVKATGYNGATASETTPFSVGVLANVAAVFATATADGNDNAYLGNEGGTGGATVNAGGLDVEATGSDGSKATVSLSGGGTFSGLGGNATANTNPTISTHLGNSSSVNVTGNVTVQSNSITGGNAHAQGASGGIVDVAVSLGNTNVKPTITTYVGDAKINAGGTITVDSVNGAPQNVSTGAFTYKQVNNNQISFVNQKTGAPQDTNLVTGDNVTLLEDGNQPIGNSDQFNTGDPNDNWKPGDDAITGLGNGQVYSVIVINPNTLELGATFQSSIVNLQNDTLYFPTGFNLQTGEKVLYQDNGAPAIPGLISGATYYVDVVDPTHIKLTANFSDFTAEQYLLSINGTYTQGNFYPFSVNVPYQVGDYVSYEPKTNVSEDQINTITANQINGSIITMANGQNGKPLPTDYRQGQELIYRVGQGSTPIGGLTPLVGVENQAGPQYYYAIVKGLPTGEFELSKTFNQQTGQIGPPITLNTNGTTGYQIFTRADKEIGGMEYGDTYKIAGKNGSNLELDYLNGKPVDPFNQDGQSLRDEDGTLAVVGAHFTSAGGYREEYTTNIGNSNYPLMQIRGTIIHTFQPSFFTLPGKGVVVYSPGNDSTPIGGLTPGQTYYVIVPNPNDPLNFELSATPGGAPITLNTTNLYGTQIFAVPSQQNLVIPLNNPNLVPTSPTPYELLGVGASSNSPGGGGLNALATGFAQAGTVGSGGGFVRVGGSTSNVTLDATVHTFVGSGANLTAGGDVSVTSTSTLNTTANGSNTGGGFVAVGGGNSTITLINANSTDIDGSAVILAQGNVILNSTSNNNVQASSNSNGGGAVAIVKAETIVYLVPQTEVSVAAGAKVTAKNFLIVSSDTNTTASADASGSGGGLGVNASNTAVIYQGQESVDDPSKFATLGDADPAYSLATIGGTLTGQNTIVDALTSYSLTAVSNAQAYAFGAAANATAATESNDFALVHILTGANITGTNSVDIEARHDNVFLHANAQCGCHAAFGSANSNTYQNILSDKPASDYSSNEFGGYSWILAEHGATIYTPDLLVQSLATFQNVWIENNTYGGFIVSHNDNDDHGALTANRVIDWNADVVSGASTSNNLLIVNANGTVDPSSTIKPTITATQIIVPDITGASSNGTITFVANQVTLAPTPSGDYKKVNNQSGDGLITSGPGFPGFLDVNPLGTFYFQQTTGPIRIINNSTKNLVINSIDVVNRGSTTNNVTINVMDDGVHSIDANNAEGLISLLNPFHFLVAYAPAAATLVDIENLTTKASPYILLQGTINNPIGTTKIVNVQGNILAPPTAVESGLLQPYVITNILDLEADKGQIGSGSASEETFHASLVQSADVNNVLRPIQVTVMAGTNAYLTLQGILRVPPFDQTSMTIPLQSIHAGNDVVAYLQDSVRESATGGGFGINVYENYPNRTTFTQSFFFPDKGSSNTGDPGLFFGTQFSEVPINSVYDFQDVAAGHDITLTGQPVTSTITITGNTNDNFKGPGTGVIDAFTNGDITLNESVGAMRVDSIQSTNGNVTLTVPAEPIRGQDLIIDPNGQYRQVLAAGSLLMDAGGNVEIPANSTLAAGASLVISGGYGAQALPGAIIDVLGKITAPEAAVYADSASDIVNLARGQDTTPTFVFADESNDTINVRNNGGALSVFSTGGLATINVSSTAGLPGNPPGVVSGIVGPVTVNGSSTDTMNVSDTGDTTDQKTGLLTATTLTGLGMGKGITYLGLANLNVYLGSGNDNFTITGINPPTATLVDGGKGTNYVTAAFQQDFQGNLTLVHFQDGTVSVGQDFDGTMTDLSPGNLTSVTIGGSMTTTGQFAADGNVGTLTVGGIVNNQAAPGDVAGHVKIGGDLNLGYIYGSLSGQVAVGGNVNEILEVFGNSSGSVKVGKNVNEFSVLGSQSGSFNAGGNVSDLEIDTGLTSTGTVRVGGNLFSLKAGSDASSPSNGLFGQVVVVGNLFQLQTNGALTGIVAVGGNVGQDDYGGILAGGLFSGQLVVQGSVIGDLQIQGDMTGRVAVEGPQGIQGNVEVDGSMGSSAAIFSHGAISNAGGGTAVTVAGSLSGILAADGAINLGSIGSKSGGSIIAKASGVNADAIDAIFVDLGRQLSIASASDLALILADLASLHIGSDGKLHGLRP